MSTSLSTGGCVHLLRRGPGSARFPAGSPACVQTVVALFSFPRCLGGCAFIEEGEHLVVYSTCINLSGAGDTDRQRLCDKNEYY